MPTYDYKCLDCGHQFEQHVKLHDFHQNQKCEKCGSFNTQREVAAVKSYRVSGDNSSSTTPRRFRG